VLSQPTKFGVLKKALHAMHGEVSIGYYVHLYNVAQFPLCWDVNCGPHAATDSRKSSGSNGFNCGGI